MNAPDLSNMKRNAQGHWVEIDNIDDIDLARDELVMELVEKAISQREQLIRLKAEMMGDIQAFIELSMERYGVKVGGKKGNVSLTSFDGNYRIIRQISDNLSFDERLQAAKALIDECIHEWTDSSSANVKTLIDHAFQVDREGNINTGRVLGLRRLKITDKKWQRAMDAISDSIQIIDSKPYVRMYKRDSDTDRYMPISLDIAGV